MGEPLNVILSGDSDAEVLVKSVDDGGFLNYMLYVQLFRYIKASYPRQDLRLTLWAARRVSAKNAWVNI